MRIFNEFRLIIVSLSNSLFHRANSRMEASTITVAELLNTEEKNV